jgi:hypothetical protein
VPVSLPNASGSAGTTVLIPVTVDVLTGQNVTAYDFTASFDPAILELASPAFETAGTLTGATGGYSVFIDANQPSGRVRIGAFGTTPLSGSGTLIFLRFNVLAGASATSPLNFEQFIFGEGASAVSMTNGTVMRLGTTASVATVSGRVLTANGNGVRNAGVTMTDARGITRTATTTSLGYYRFEGVAAGETYVFTASGKSITFSQSTRVLNIGNDISDVNFIAFR